jgi:hypothetical protein
MVYEKQLGKLQKMWHNVGATKPYGKVNLCMLVPSLHFNVQSFQEVVNVMCTLLLNIELYNLFF